MLDPNVVELTGAVERTRTSGLLLRRETLYPLSYDRVDSNYQIASSMPIGPGRGKPGPCRGMRGDQPLRRRRAKPIKPPTRARAEDGPGTGWVTNSWLVPLGKMPE